MRRATGFAAFVHHVTRHFSEQSTGLGFPEVFLYRLGGAVRVSLVGVHGLMGHAVMLPKDEVRRGYLPAKIVSVPPEHSHYAPEIRELLAHGCPTECEPVGKAVCQGVAVTGW